MKNTKFRKRALLSSVAMLLVALVALGSATFAWFTSSTTATADQLSVRTVKASELQVSDYHLNWTDSLHYNVNDRVLKPASSADGTNWFAADADNKNAFGADLKTVQQLTSTDVGIGVNSSYVFMDQLNVKNNGAAAVNNVTIKFSLSETKPNSGNYLRLALVPASTGGASATVTAANFKAATSMFAAVADSADAIKTLTDAGTASAAITTETVTATSAASTVTFNVGNLTAKDTADAVKYYNLYVWFEGQDLDCKDANAGNSMPPITFTVEGETAATT